MTIYTLQVMTFAIYFIFLDSYFIADQYGDRPIYITANGLSEPVIKKITADCNLELGGNVE